MKIAIDARELTNKHKAGKGWYVHNLLHALFQLKTKHEFILYTKGKLKLAKKPKHITINQVKGGSLIWHYRSARDIESKKYDLFFAPTSFIIPTLLSKKIRSVITVHDLIAFLYPLKHQAKATIIEKMLLKRALKKTSHIITPSENTKRDLTKLFGTSSIDISVTPLAASNTFYEKYTFKKSLQDKWALPKQFILSVGTLQPRKNITALFKASARIFKDTEFMKSAEENGDIGVVIVGVKGWRTKELETLLRKIRHRIAFLDYVTEEELAQLYQCAKMFVFPSRYEGFGIPPLEAMASGCPVICSNAASLTEVVGNATLNFEPKDISTLEKHMRKLFTDKELRMNLIEKGRRRAEDFDWDKTAQKTLSIFDKILA